MRMCIFFCWYELQTCNYVDRWIKLVIFFSFSASNSMGSDFAWNRGTSSTKRSKKLWFSTTRSKFPWRNRSKSGFWSNRNRTMAKFTSGKNWIFNDCIIWYDIDWSTFPFEFFFYIFSEFRAKRMAIMMYNERPLGMTKPIQHV